MKTAYIIVGLIVVYFFFRPKEVLAQDQYADKTKNSGSGYPNGLQDLLNIVTGLKPNADALPPAPLPEPIHIEINPIAPAPAPAPAGPPPIASLSPVLSPTSEPILTALPPPLVTAPAPGRIDDSVLLSSGEVLRNIDVGLGFPLLYIKGKEPDLFSREGPLYGKASVIGYDPFREKYG